MTYVFVKTRMCTERPVQTFEDESNMVRIITREGSWDDISMHHHTVNMTLVKTKLL